MPVASTSFFTGITATKTDTSSIDVSGNDKVAVTLVGADTAVATVVIYGVDSGGNNRELHTETFTADDEKVFDCSAVGFHLLTVHVTAYTTGTFAAYLNAR